MTKRENIKKRIHDLTIGKSVYVRCYELNKEKEDMYLKETVDGLEQRLDNLKYLLKEEYLKTNNKKVVYGKKTEKDYYTTLLENKQQIKKVLLVLKDPNYREKYLETNYDNKIKELENELEMTSKEDLDSEVIREEVKSSHPKIDINEVKNGVYGGRITSDMNKLKTITKNKYPEIYQEIKKIIGDKCFFSEVDMGKVIGLLHKYELFVDQMVREYDDNIDKMGNIMLFNSEREILKNNSELYYCLLDNNIPEDVKEVINSGSDYVVYDEEIEMEDMSDFESDYFIESDFENGDSVMLDLIEIPTSEIINKSISVYNIIKLISSKMSYLRKIDIVDKDKEPIMMSEYDIILEKLKEVNDSMDKMALLNREEKCLKYFPLNLV